MMFAASLGVRENDVLERQLSLPVGNFREAQRDPGRESLKAVRFWRPRRPAIGTACPRCSNGYSAPAFTARATVSQVRVVTSLSNVFSISVMKTGPLGLGT